MQGRLMLDTDEKRQRASRMGIADPNRKYSTSELASGDVLFAATGVTDGSLLSGVRYRAGSIRTSTVVMRSWSQTVRWITAEHRR
jgi:fructose-1,6-bisphosphatase II / sedoheptulose-1,7-bisphosphatase